MIPEVESKVRALAAQCQDLSQDVRRLARSEDPPALVEERLRKALVHVELALEAVERRPEETAAAPSGRFLARFSGMVDRLAGGKPPTRRADARLKLAGSIASLRQAPARPRGSGGMRGNSATITIPDFLGFLQIQGKTGLLEVTLANERITMHVSRGDLVDAFSDNSPKAARLGEILVEQGALDHETLDAFFVYHNKSKGRLGRALEVNELVTEEQLRGALAEQVVQMVRRMLNVKDAPYVFHEGRVDESTSDIRIGVIELLLESARQVDEAKRRESDEPAAALPSSGSPEETAEKEETVEDIDMDNVDLDELRERIKKLDD